MAIVNEMSQRSGQTAILTPDARRTLLRDALDTVRTRTWKRPGGQTFGPYPFTWEQQDSEAVDALISGLTLPEAANYTEFCAALAPISDHGPISHAIGRMDRLRKLCGQTEFTSAQVAELVREAVRNQSRLGFRQQRGHLAMTIQRAKNREFQNVIVLWPYSAAGSPEHLRRLVYNAITRAMNHCSVIVLGQGRLNGPPFGTTARDSRRSS